jgi:hypothetical protein
MHCAYGKNKNQKQIHKQAGRVLVRKPKSKGQCPASMRAACILACATGAGYIYIRMEKGVYDD